MPQPHPCEARGISLIPDLQHCKNIVKSPRYKHFNFAAAIPYSISTGIWHQDSDDHVNWWIYQSTNPLNVVVKVEALK
ncbi:hypothetical protein [Variovorax sp. PvP013]|uniref:hypothetical protein n=1 Tax=Variovorax sp. PvP013 TaxID=3156435 RepID=UPI003D21A090